jgi:hypothetical protein
VILKLLLGPASAVSKSVSDTMWEAYTKATSAKFDSYGSITTALSNFHSDDKKKEIQGEKPALFKIKWRNLG